MKDRRNVAIVITILLGLVIGEFIKRTTIGLIIGLGIGLYAASMISGKKGKKDQR